MPKRIFLDYASCTPVRDEIKKAYFKMIEECYINSEAVYHAGVEVHNLVESSRERIAKLLHVKNNEIIFTSGASEANAYAIKGYALKNKNKGNHIITTSMEHSSVLHAVQQLESEFGFDVTYLPVYKDGKIKVDDIKKALRDDTILVSVMAVNNEIGSIQPIEEIGSYLKDKKAKFHIDAVQSIGKISIDISNVDMMTITSHKIYGVKGCGVLYRRNNIELLPLINGGQQEFNVRGGTLNAPSCIVFAKTLRLALEEQKEHYAYVKKLSDYLEEEVKKLDYIVVNSPVDHCPYVLNFSCTKIGSEIMMNALNARNICVSTQSTCSSRTKAPSHTLTAMGLDESITYGAIRVSFSHLTTKEEVDYLLESLREIIHDYKTK